MAHRVWFRTYPAGEVRGAPVDLNGGVEILTDAATLALYTTDASNYRHVPRGVVLPRTVDDVVAAVASARDRDLPVIARGGGTSVAGTRAVRGW